MGAKLTDQLYRKIYTLRVILARGMHHTAAHCMKQKESKKVKNLSAILQLSEPKTPPKVYHILISVRSVFMGQGFISA